MSTEKEGQDKKDDLPINQAQRGIFLSRHTNGKFVNITLNTKEITAKEKILLLVKALTSKSIAMDNRSVVIVGVNPQLWNLWGCKVPLEPRPTSSYLIPNSKKFVSTLGDIFFYIKSDSEENANELLALLQHQLQNEIHDLIESVSFTESAKILRGLFIEGMANNSDSLSVSEHILIGEKGNGLPGGTYMMTQKFKINWDIMGSKTTTQMENMIGRHVHTNILVQPDYKRSHIMRAHHVDEFPNPCNISKSFRRVFRQSLPYGVSTSGIGREEGVFYVAVTKSSQVFVEILENLAGCQSDSTNGEIVSDELMNALIAIEGTFWYIPNKEELEIIDDQENVIDLSAHWEDRSKNGLMFYNQRDYLHAMASGKYQETDPPSAKVLGLLGYTFEQWNHQWFKIQTPPDMPELRDVLTPDESSYETAPIPIRKGMAIKKTLGEVYTTSDMTRDPSEFYGWKADLFNIHPDEIIVGRMPRFSLGIGRTIMHYLSENERAEAFLVGLSEESGVGHVTPQHEKFLRLGLDGLILDIRERIAAGITYVQDEFYQSVILALEGVQMYMENYGKLAAHLSSLKSEYTSEQVTNLLEISNRMQKLAHKPAETLVEAVQMVFTMHSCLHLTGEPVALGRFDQYLEPYENTCSPEDAQEVIDCFWIKLSERLLLNKHYLVDQTKWGTCALPYATNGLFPKGDLINQWVQQLTVGGYKASQDETPIPASNKITMHCLKAARRLPLNAPCLSLRVHEGISADIIVEAAKSLLSGGAHPILIQDDRLCPSLLNCGSHLQTPLTLSEARDFACDGCYEPMIDGKSEFAFTYVPLTQIIELSMNKGCLYALTGPYYLSGTPASITTDHPENIKTFESFQSIFEKHLKFQIQRNMFNLMVNYGNIWKFCPGPLLSSVIGGCLETGRDHYNAGAKYHILSCMFIGFSNCVDSLYAIKRMCYDHDSAIVSLTDLLECLKCDWGFSMQEPYVEDIAGPTRTAEKRNYYQSMRNQALLYEKFGSEAVADNKDIQEIVAWLSDLIISSFNSVVYNKDLTAPLPSLIEDLKKRYSVPGSPFDFLFLPGSGTFEGYVGWGLSCGASPDGRRNRMPLASDFSPAPTPQDMEPCPSHCNVFKALRNWNHPAIKLGFSCGAEIDLNISEDFPLEDMIRFIYDFSKEDNELGGNILTVTCADEETYTKAMAMPEKYGLVRVRMGGWSEVYTSMFKAHQEQHRRRMYFTAK